MIRFLVCGPLLLIRHFIEIVFVELRIFRPVFFFLFDDLREQFTPGAWRDLRERNRSLVVNVAGGTSPMVRPVVCDHAPACLERLACRRRRRCPQHAMPSGFGSLVQATGGSGRAFFAALVPFGLSPVRRPGERLPGHPGAARCWTPLGGGTVSSTKTLWYGALSKMMRERDGI